MSSVGVMGCMVYGLQEHKPHSGVLLPWGYPHGGGGSEQ